MKPEINHPLVQTCKENLGPDNINALSAYFLQREIVSQRIFENPKTSCWFFSDRSTKTKKNIKDNLQLEAGTCCCTCSRRSHTQDRRLQDTPQGRLKSAKCESNIDLFGSTRYFMPDCAESCGISTNDESSAEGLFFAICYPWYFSLRLKNSVYCRRGTISVIKDTCTFTLVHFCDGDGRQTCSLEDD